MKTKILLLLFLTGFLNFTISQNCTPPSPVSPENGSTVYTTTPTLCWDAGSGVFIGRSLLVSGNPDFTNVIFYGTFEQAPGCQTVSAPPPGFQYNHWYWWKIRVQCYYGTFESQVYSFYTSITAITPISNEIPSDFSLSQNYPNPFNPVTKIKFDIPLSRGVPEGRGVSVSLIIYNVLGKEITTLVNEKLSPGTFEVEWNGSNFPTGVYFYRLVVSGAETLITADYSETRKMVLIK